ncbi:MAG: exodeoxyribonuclease III [Acidimicrobiia bacterium]|nr:exodeoxyribonuclease III [Acidimicrobiia bacterium]
MRVATWNVNSLGARLERVEAWLAEVEPDVVCLQETKLADDAFPSLTFSALGYESFHHGQGRWNGVAVLSRVGLEAPAAGFSPDDVVPRDEARIVSATCGGVRVVSVYVPNGRSPDHEQYQFKLEWLAALRGHLDAACRPTADLLVCGDFNIAPDDRDVYDPAKFVGSTHVTPAERSALDGLLEWGLVDVFRRHHDEAGLYSWWDYRAGDFHQGRGLRIDLVLATPALAEKAVWSLVDRNARKGKPTPSDHAPVIVEFG